jgi:cyanophycinase
MSRLMIVRGHPYDVPGLGLLPGVVIDQHFIARNRKPRLVAALEKYPGLVGLGIDEGTALVARGRSLRVLGESTVTICLRGSQTRPARETVLKPGETADLTALCRAAVARTQPPFPPAELLVPNLPQGTLVIVGGGKMPLGLPEKFIELAGGPEALIAVLPTANPDPLPEKLGDAAFLERAGAKNIKLLRARTREEVESPEFLEAIQAARGIWFGGGRQWRFVDAYGETRAVPAFHDVLRRGGVIGGSSAGATIQGDYLVRGSPLGNEEMMAEGYERGFAFLPGVAIDQHFSQRKRQPDMTQVMQAHPQLLGIGLDESTALIVRGHTAEIVGEHDAYFYNRRQPLVDGQPDYEKVPSGQHYDLVARKVKGAAQP